MSQAAENQFYFSCKVLSCVVASPISGTGRRGRSNVFGVLMVLGVAGLLLPSPWQISGGRSCAEAVCSPRGDSSSSRALCGDGAQLLRVGDR